MGVRFLQTFMKREVQNGAHYIQILREISNSAEQHDRKPLILIDLMALHELFKGDNCSVLCGSQVMLCEQQAAQFFSQLVESGAELVFFWDGNVQANKYDTWLERQNDKYTRMITVIDAINQGQPLQRIATKHSFNIPPNTCLQLKRIAESYGRVIVSIHAECDQELAAYALEHEALAIISNDTDFLIFNGCWQIWSANIDLKTLRTLAFSKDALRWKLKLSIPAMAIWATLAGNDFYNYEQLKPFHDGLGQAKFLKLAQYVRTLPVVERFDDNVIQQVLRCVYKRRRIPDQAVTWFRQSLDFYINDTQMRHRSKPPLDPIETFLLQESQHFVVGVLNGAPHNSTLFFFDYRSNDLGSYFDIVVPIIAKIAGIILYHRQHERGHITVVAKKGHQESYAQHNIAAVFPCDLAVPHFTDLLSRDDTMMAALLERKLQLLRWVCSDVVDDNSLAAVPHGLMVTVLTLVRLVECRIVRVFEADLLLLIAHELQTNQFVPSQEQCPTQLNPRAFRVGFLFQKVYQEISRAAQSIGLSSDYRPSTPYDGYRFHNNYDKFQNSQTDELMKPPTALWRLYVPTEKHDKSDQ
ncbi:uncharacterized protein LOC131207682 [Anopheles bellator]|uniref:uncharacterized protein LOC131207682 n=1 Tax=Anopheles bellator TaxID=139047 RepID=UPI0026482FC8|nr:uncharacterized protein LOC131207682 [Anopheles bellator]